MNINNEQSINNACGFVLPRENRYIFEKTYQLSQQNN